MIVIDCDYFLFSLFELKLCAKAVTDQKAKQWEKGGNKKEIDGAFMNRAMSNVISSKPQIICQTFVHPPFG